MKKRSSASSASITLTTTETGSMQPAIAAASNATTAAKRTPKVPKAVPLPLPIGPALMAGRTALLVALGRWFTEQEAARRALVAATTTSLDAETLAAAAAVAQTPRQAPKKTSQKTAASAASPTAAAPAVVSVVPWRDGPHATNPYAIWVCEVMSQQTQLATVARYWRRWMTRFPTVDALAAAAPATVRAEWAGMGYYRRADLLHKGAQAVVAAYGQAQGKEDISHNTKGSGGDDNTAMVPADAVTTTVAWPRRSAEWAKAVPGVGPYTAAAITSICFDEPVVAVDGNIMRVLSRLMGLQGFDPKLPANIKRMQDTLNRPHWAPHPWPAEGDETGAVCAVSSGARSDPCMFFEGLPHIPAAAAAPPLAGAPPQPATASPSPSSVVQAASRSLTRPGALNEALMLLGSSVCRPNAVPLCGQCPVAAFCAARAMQSAGDIEAIDGVIPSRGTAAKSRDEAVCTVVLFARNDGGGGNESDGRAPAGGGAKKRPREGATVATCVDSTAEKKGGAVSLEGLSVLCVTRPKGGLLSEMIDFPSWQGTPLSRLADAESVTKIPLACVAVLPAASKPAAQCGAFVHVFSHIRMTVDVFGGVVTAKGALLGDGARAGSGGGCFWCPLERLHELPVSALAIKSLTRAFEGVLKLSRAEAVAAARHLRLRNVT